jgi:YbbR domain-containing protein
MTKSKVYSALLSIIIAFGLWLYVVNNVSQEAEDTFYNIPVILENEAVLEERNLLITNQSANMVSLKLSGARSDLKKVNSGNIIIKANLATIYEPGDKVALSYTISFPGDVPSNAFVVESKNPSFIYLDVDSRRTKEVPVKIHWTGSRSGDYLYDTENALLDYSTVTVTGPAAVADRISYAQIDVDLTDRTESMSESFRYTLCDENGEPVDAQTITTSVDEVNVDLKIRRIKEVRLVAEVIYGGGTNEQNTQVVVEPAILRLSGSDAILAELGDEYTICTINLAEIERSQELKYAIPIPEGVDNITGVTEAVVSVRFNGLNSKEYTVDRFELINVPEGMEAEIMNSSLTVKIRGPYAEIAKLEAKNITAVVDLANAEIGNATFKATVVFPEEFTGVGALKTYSVSVTVRSIEE